MSETPPKEPDLSGILPRIERVTISRARFDKLFEYRVQYRLLYGIVFIAWLAAFIFGTKGLGQAQYGVYGALLLLLIGFYLRFYQVLSTLGYGFVIIFGACAAALIPMPGFLVVLIVDRQISKALGSARDAAEVAREEHRD